MHKLYVGLVALALAAIAAPVTAVQEDVRTKNFEFFSDLVSEKDHSVIATLQDGRQMPLGDALRLAAERAGDVDLAAIAAGAGPAPDTPLVGDVWVIEIGDGGCTATMVAPQPVFLGPHPQFFLYNGGVGDLSTTQGDFTLGIAWTMKVVGWLVFGSDGFTASGVQDFFCVEFLGGHFAFPFLDGVATLN